jgi:hypothetical protein
MTTENVSWYQFSLQCILEDSLILMSPTNSENHSTNSSRDFSLFCAVGENRILKIIVVLQCIYKYIYIYNFAYLKIPQQSACYVSSVKNHQAVWQISKIGLLICVFVQVSAKTHISSPIFETCHTAWWFFTDDRVYFKKNLELHILRMLWSITCLTGGSKVVWLGGQRIFIYI